MQRFGGALYLNVHFHALVLDGVFHAAGAGAAPAFRTTGRVGQADLADILQTVSRPPRHPPGTRPTPARSPAMHPVDPTPEGSLPPLEHMLDENLPALREYTLRRSGQLVASRESASDLAQSVCREVIEHLDRFAHGDEEGFRRWLFRTAERKIMNRYRYYTAGKRDAARDVAEELGIGDGKLFVTPSRDAVARGELARAQAAFDTLPARHQRAIVLNTIEGLSHAEIAAAMGTSEGAARNLVYRGLAAISRALDGE